MPLVREHYKILYIFSNSQFASNMKVCIESY